MKSHISATIDTQVLDRVDRYRRVVRRSRSQIIEMAIERLLREEVPADEGIVTSGGAFAEQFSRADTYER